MKPGGFSMFAALLTESQPGCLSHHLNKGIAGGKTGVYESGIINKLIWVSPKS